GSSNLTGRFSFQTGDVIGGDADRFLNIDDLRPFNTTESEGTLGGPMAFLGDQFFFHVSGRYYDDAGFLYGQRLVAYANNSRDNLILGDRAYVSMNPDRTYNIQGKLSFNDPSLKLSFSYLRKDRKHQEYSNAYRLAPDWRPFYFDKSSTYTLNSNYFFSPTTFASAVVAYTYSQDETRAFEDINDPRYRFRGRDLSYLSNRNNPVGDSLAAILKTALGLTATELNRFSIGPSLDRSERTGRKYSGKIDLTSQLGTLHLVKAGVEVNYFEVFREGISVVQRGTRPDNDFNVNNEVVEIPEANTRSRNIFRGKPTQLGAYVQDKMEFSEFVLNVGVRLDYYDPKTTVPVDFTKLDGTAFVATSKKWKVSPRVSFAHSVTDRSKLFFS
ncbi:MAG: hypothetical protein AABZ61_14760, partial [Bacteroidota bacterium]